jgi:hypothetical protein
MRCYPKEDSAIQSHKFKRSTAHVHIEQHMVSTGSRQSIILGAISPIEHMSWSPSNTKNVQM